MWIRVLIFTMIIYWLGAIPMWQGEEHNLTYPNTTSLTRSIEEGIGSGGSKVYDLINISHLIKAAVYDTTWMFCADEQSLQEVLSRYYTGPLLGNLTEECRQFIELKTDWYGLTMASNVTVVSITPPRSCAVAELKYVDVNTGNVYQGRGTYVLLKTPGGWKIEQASYTWH